MNGKTIVCITAHPDDEAFGPSGTIAQLSGDNDVYVVCATKGQSGQDSSKAEGKLINRRVKELKESAKILGVKKVFFLGFRDGTLSNNLYHKLASKIQEYLEELKPEIIITFAPTGVSGHVDHVVISLVSSYVFYKLPFIKEMWQRVITPERSEDLSRDYFVYVPPGTERKNIDKIVDVSGVWDLKVAAMKQHESQRHDYERILESAKKFPKEEYFIVIKK